jgi:hypothetical protein
MNSRSQSIVASLLVLSVAVSGSADAPRVEVSEDGLLATPLRASPTDGQVVVQSRSVPFGSTPDWQNSLRRQVGALQVVDMNGDGWMDVVVGCYTSQSYPPYPDWENMIYYNTGGQLEANPSWISADEVSTGDIQVGDINQDTYPDIFSANGGFAMSPSVIYWGSPAGPSNAPGWSSNVPGLAWCNYARIFDFDHDNDLDVVTANQGNSPSDPYRPLYAYYNNNGTLSTTPGWQSLESSIQNFLDFADYDGDGWEDLAVSKWSNFNSGVYRVVNGTIQPNPTWTTGDDDSDKGVAWADFDGNGWPDFALGHDPTRVYDNTAGTLTLGWSATGTYFGQQDFRACDIDRDGDPDLADIHFSNGHVRIYLNDNGALTTSPAWVYDSPGAGTAIAFGDINGDQWVDLVVGNSGDPSVFVFYAQAPDVPGDFNNDGVVDVDDLEIFGQCMGGPDNPNPGCLPGQFNETDMDTDGDTDIADCADFQNAL